MKERMRRVRRKKRDERKQVSVRNVEAEEEEVG